MAVSFTVSSILIFLLSLPNLSSSCSTHPPSCVASFDIQPPFFTDPIDIDPKCNGTYYIYCHGAKPMIKFQDQNHSFWSFVVKNISYSDKTITLQYEDISNLYRSSTCNTLYNFTHPLPHFEKATHPILDDAFLFNCAYEGYNSLTTGLNTVHHSSLCEDYDIYYGMTSQILQEGLPANCREPQHNQSFEWKLSFRESAKGLSMLFAGISSSLDLRPECFNNRSLCHRQQTRSSPSKVSNKKIIIAGGTGFAGSVFFIILVLYVVRRTKKNLDVNQINVEVFLENYGSLAPKRYTYSYVKKITKSFHEKLGQGGYGSVFKGRLSDGRLVAVKVLSNSKGNGEEFVNEIISIGRSSHVNIVNLLGFCLEGSKKALIYEYMCNGSLDKLICSEKPKTTLDWEKLYQIAIGIARGLEYLHRGCNTKIVHFDIKPHNILLDEVFCPKIADFGLAKLCVRKNSILSMEGTRGTIGYIAPEVFSRNFGVVSSKSDIYSYGMMVLEMAGGRKNMSADIQDTSENYFPQQIYKHLEQNGDLQAYGATADTEEVVRKMVLVGLWCIQTLPQNRPPITRVIEMLEGSINDLQFPPKPYLFFPSPLGSLPNTSSVQDGC